ncbi:MAG: aldo/keto reductase [Polyangiales bacterium]
MKYQQVGHSGLKVSELSLGAMTFGRETSAADAGRIVAAAIERGVNFFDTANTYANSESEKIVGEVLKSTRHSQIIATKFGNPITKDANGQGASRVHILRQVEESLRRLQTDYIDVYYVHHVDHVTPFDETLSALDSLVKSGKVRYVGASNFEAWRLLESLWVAQTRGYTPYVIYQPQYNLLVRDIEDEIVPVCRLKGVGIVPWSPLAGGWLSGKYRSVETAPRDTRIADRGLGRSGSFHADNRDAIVQVLRSVATELGATPAAVALRWVLDQPGVSSAIIGARTLEQAEANLAALELQLPADKRALLDKVSSPRPRYPKDSESNRTPAA